MAKIDAVLQALRKCQRKLQHLRTGRHFTQSAAGAFTDLSNEVQRVIEERRTGGDRRKVGRATSERRRNGKHER